MAETAQMISSLVEKARAAQKIAAGYSQQQLDDICFAVAWEVYNDENIKILAEMAVEETGMGNVPDKIAKHKGKVLGVINDVKGVKSTGCIEEIPEKKIKKYAKPVGVVGALTPVTNPTATPASNGVSILKGGNAVIFAPHPRSKKASAKAVEFMRRGLKKVGAPEDLIQIVKEPSIEATGELMKQVDLVLATGGSAMVKAAYSSGTPAYGVGPGNSVQIIAEDADWKDAVAKVVLSKCFDNATSCSSENSIIVEDSIYENVLKELEEAGTYVCRGEERKTLEEWMWIPGKTGHRSINPAIIAKSAEDIAAGAGLKVPAGTRILLVEGVDAIEDDFFSLEKLSPVLTIFKYRGFDRAMEILIRLTDNCGTGHSCGIHTKNNDYMERMSLQMRTSRIMINQPQAPANGGNFFNGMASTTTLGCGTWGGNITTENITYKHFLNVTYVSEWFAPVKPTDDEIWGDFFRRYE
ncbi:aldehyde dehydrogenase family protein [Spirochaeta isovalerica]|uniref:Sulfoacetaldehyde dehydrogenase n=1 Tax=Spirochaeta isovalerica TaxID=150 RepID=A0A841RGJ6_9SPIO|nr:aldehyde dehydrogenase family protein [Spirochaeta isovalerica]MBB6482511.1 sulfoacetaldehyde dehydrogenase [Spirochaeta isovalerica]